MIDLNLYRKLANTYQVDSSEQNAINSFKKQADRMWDNTISTYDLLAHTNRGDDVLLTDYEGTVVQSRGVFNYAKTYDNERMQKGVQRVYLQKDSVKLGYYVDRVETSEKYLIIAINEDKFKYEDAFVQRCHDDLRFYDEFGIYHKVPCAMNKSSFYDLKKDQLVMIPDNQLRVLVPYTDVTKMIKWADEESPNSKYTRFILNGQAYKAVSLDSHYDVQYGEGVMEVRLQADQISATDDLVNGIADANVSVTLEILNGSALTIGSGQTVQLNPKVTVNTLELTNPIVKYVSSNESIATVDESGLVLSVSSGITTITASYGNVSDTIEISVDSLPIDNYTIDITSSNGITDIIRLNQTLSYTAISLINGVEYINVGTWELLQDDGITPLPSTVVSVLETVGNVIKVKASKDYSLVNTYFKIKYTDSNHSEMLRIKIKSII